MNADTFKMVVQFVVYPLVLALVGVSTAFYRRDLKYVKESIETEKVSRKEGIAKNDERTEKMFSKLDGITDSLGDIKGSISAQERICNIRHGTGKEV